MFASDNSFPPVERYLCNFSPTKLSTFTTYVWKLMFFSSVYSVMWSFCFTCKLTQRWHTCLDSCECRGGSRGRVQGVRTPPWDYLRFSYTTGILPKNKLCGLLVLKWSKRRAHPLLKKILHPPLECMTISFFLCCGRVGGWGGGGVHWVKEKACHSIMRIRACTLVYKNWSEVISSTLLTL